MLKVGIVGLGHIADKMACTLEQMEDARLFAVASRSREKAVAFSKKHPAEKVYGSYGQLLEDNEVDLVYVATVHTEHFTIAKQALLEGRNVLVEKAFTVNLLQAEELVQLAKERHLLLCEAMWTRFMPSRKMIESLIADGTIGEVKHLSADLSYKIDWKERVFNPALAGGSLLDIGIYPLNFAVMVLGKDIARIQTCMVPFSTGVDAIDQMTLVYHGGKLANLTASMFGLSDRRGMIYGTKGYLEVQNINNPEVLRIFDDTGKLAEERHCPKQISGYEYEVRACAKAIAEGKVECPEMPHQDTLFMMKLMDTIRRRWGLVYPCERE